MGTNMYISLVYFEQKCDDFDFMFIESTEGSTLHCKVQKKNEKRFLSLLLAKQTGAGK